MEGVFQLNFFVLVKNCIHLHVWWFSPVVAACASVMLLFDLLVFWLDTFCLPMLISVAVELHNFCNT